MSTRIRIVDCRLSMLPECWECCVVVGSSVVAFIRCGSSAFRSTDDDDDGVCLFVWFRVFVSGFFLCCFLSFYVLSNFLQKPVKIKVKIINNYPAFIYDYLYSYFYTFPLPFSTSLCPSLTFISCSFGQWFKCEWCIEEVCVSVCVSLCKLEVK